MAKPRQPNLSLPWERRTWWSRLGDSGGRARTAAALVLLVASVVIAIDHYAHTRRVRETDRAIAEVRRALTAFRTDFGRCPTSTGELLHPSRTRRTYLRELPSDGWGRPLWIRCPAYFDPGGEDVVSAGPDGDFFSEDILE